MLMNELNFASDAIRRSRLGAGEDGRAAVGLPLLAGRKAVRLVVDASLGAGQSVAVVVFSIAILIVVVVVSRTGILLTALLLDAVVPTTASALSRTLDPVAGRRREIVRISLAKFVCKRSKTDSFFIQNCLYQQKYEYNAEK